METILYPELVDYIFNYCSKYMTDDEKKVQWLHFEMLKNNDGIIGKAYTIFKNKGFLSTDQEATNLLKNGYSSFKETVAIRIYEEHKEDLGLNLCPNCFKIARTPNAKQCRFCFHNWH